MSKPPAGANRLAFSEYQIRTLSGNKRRPHQRLVARALYAVVRAKAARSGVKSCPGGTRSITVKII